MDFDKKILNYVKESFGPAAEVSETVPSGRGTHGTAWRLKIETPHEKRHLVLKTLFPAGFGHDHFSDRARVLLLANANYNEMPKHVESFDVLGESPDRLISLKDTREFYILMSEAKGTAYFEDLNAILARGHLTDMDRERVEALARFLAVLHATKSTGQNIKTLYRRRIRDLLGHGECIMGLIDAFDAVAFASDHEFIDFVSKCVPWWGRIRNRSERLCEVHGDFHPGNIWFHNDDFTLLDRARGTWGEPADDVSCLSVNYIFYAVKQTGTFEGPFSELLRLFFERYLDQTGDYDILHVVQPFFAFRVLVLINPKFYPGENNQIRRRLLDFGQAVLGTEKFDVEKISDYLEKK